MRVLLGVRQEAESRSTAAWRDGPSFLDCASFKAGADVPVNQTNDFTWLLLLLQQFYSQRPRLFYNFENPHFSVVEAFLLGDRKAQRYAKHPTSCEGSEVSELPISFLGWGGVRSVSLVAMTWSLQVGPHGSFWACISLHPVVAVETRRGVWKDPLLALPADRDQCS